MRLKDDRSPALPRDKSVGEFGALVEYGPPGAPSLDNSRPEQHLEMPADRSEAVAGERDQVAGAAAGGATVRRKKFWVGCTRFVRLLRHRSVTFGEFAATRLPRLLRYAVMLTGDRELAQDVVQEVLARAQVRWRKISGADSPDAYVRQMVLNEYLSWRRRWAVRAVQAVGEQLLELSDARRGSRDHADAFADAEDLWNQLATLPRKQRAVLVLRYYEQLDDDEIAALLGCARGTVRSNASKALKTLRLQSERQHITVAGEI